MPQLPILKGALHYEVHGPKGAPAALVLPGAFTAPWQYDPVRDHLAREFRVTTLDYRGIGESANDLWTVTPQQLGADVLQLLDFLDVEQTHVVAVSLGTFVLSELLHQAPGRIARCALGGLPAMRRSIAFLGQAADQTFQDQKTLDALGKANRVQQLAASVVPQFVSKRFREEQPARYNEMVARMAELDTDGIWAGLQQFYGVFGYDWRRTRIFEQLPASRRLLLTGDGDPFAPLGDLPEHPVYRAGPTVVFEGSGHMFFYEMVDTFSSVVDTFFKTGQPPRPLPPRVGLLQEVAS